MTPKEAIKQLEMDRDLCRFNPMTGECKPMNEDCRKTADALDIAIEVLEKQIPKKPILKNGETLVHLNKGDKPHEWQMNKWQDWVCPVCGWFVGQRYNASQAHPHDQRKSKFCNECGQAIDFEELEE